MKKNIKYFKKCTKEAIKFFGLHSFQFHICEQLRDSSRASNYYHEINPEDDGRMFTICYSLHWINNKDITKEDIRKTAFHEVFETMFYKLRDFSNKNHIVVSRREVDSEIHSIIRTFENKILPLIPEN